MRLKCEVMLSHVFISPPHLAPGNILVSRLSCNSLSLPLLLALFLQGFLLPTGCTPPMPAHLAT